MTIKLSEISKLTKMFVLFLLALSIVGYSALYANQEKEAVLKIKVFGLKSNDGDVKVSVFNAEKDWLEKPLHEYAIKIQDNKCELTVENIPYGEYAFSAVHDKNLNGKLDKTGFLPKEPYGFSNNAKGMFGPAKWKDAKLQVKSPVEEIIINVK